MYLTATLVRSVCVRTCWSFTYYFWSCVLIFFQSLLRYLEEHRILPRGGIQCFLINSGEATVALNLP